MSDSTRAGSSSDTPPVPFAVARPLIERYTPTRPNEVAVRSDSTDRERTPREPPAAVRWNGPFVNAMNPVDGVIYAQIAAPEINAGIVVTIWALEHGAGWVVQVTDELHSDTDYELVLRYADMTSRRPVN